MSKESSTFYVFVVIGVFLFSFIFGECGRCARRHGKNKYSSHSYSNSKYTLKFGNNFNKGDAIKSEMGISVLIAVDCSGSMDDYPASGGKDHKYVIASRALTKIINFLEDFYKNKASKEGLILKIGIIKFSSDTKIVSKLLKMNLANFTRLRQITSNPNNFYPEGATAIGSVLEVGSEMLAQSETIFKSFIIITDGENTEGINPEVVLKAIVENVNNKSTTDFPIYTDNILVSFIGFDIGQYVFDNLHKIGARVMSAGNEKALEDALKNIFLTDISKLE